MTVPTTRKKIARNIRGEISAFAIKTLSDGLFYPKAEAKSIEDQNLNYATVFPEACSALWREHGEAIVTAWAEKHPGTRPSWFWLFPEPRCRQRIGGHGFPKSDFLAYVPSFFCGLPDNWLCAEDVETWADLADKEVDPADPPTFESQATYLKRMNLLLPSEESRIPRKAWLPEKIIFEEEEE